MRFPIFPLHLSKVLCLPRKAEARSYEVLHLSRKIISANLKIWCSKMEPLSGNQRPHLQTAPMKMSLVLRLPRKMHLCRSYSNVPRPPSFLDMLENLHVLLPFDKVHNPLRLPSGTTSERPKVLRTLHFFCTFDFDMCFAPQQRALFRHLNFQMRFDTEVFCTFWLPNVLRATMACTFPTAQLLKVLRGWGVLYILTWKCASRHNGVHFFISHLARLLRTRRFSEPTFRPSRATNLRKNAVSVLRLSYLFAHLDLLSSETFSFASFLRTWIFFLLRLSLSCSLLFSYSSHLCFSSVHIVGSLTCKLLNFLRYSLFKCPYPYFSTYIKYNIFIYIYYLWFMHNAQFHVNKQLALINTHSPKHVWQCCFGLVPPY